MISIERRIYQKSPTPRNQELADGFNTLLDEYGKTASTHIFGGALDTFTLLKMSLNNDSGKRAIIDISRDNTSGVIIFHSYAKPENEKFYSPAVSVAVDENTSGVKFWTGQGNILDHELPDEGRKAVGEIILMCWEKLNQPKPSTR